MAICGHLAEARGQPITVAESQGQEAGREEVPPWCREVTQVTPAAGWLEEDVGRRRGSLAHTPLHVLH